MKKLYLLLIFIHLLWGGVLNEERLKSLELKEEMTKIQKKEGLFNLISPLNLSLSGKKDNKSDKMSQDASINFNQDIFKFGALFYSADEVKNTFNKNIFELNKEKTKLYQELYNDIIDTRITDLQIEKKKREIENKNLELKIKKEKLSIGNASIDELNNILISLNKIKQSLISLKITRLNLIEKIKITSDQSYKNIKIPTIKLSSEEEFIKKSPIIKTAKFNKESKKNMALISKASNYFPTLSINARYAKKIKEKKENSYSYGFSLSMPLSFGKILNVEKSKLDHLIAMRELREAKLKEKVKYKSFKNEIKLYKENIKLAKIDLKLYEDLIKNTKEKLSAGLSNKEALKILTNTKLMRDIDIDINKLNINKTYIKLLAYKDF